VEVSRATALADPSEDVAQDTRRLLGSCLLVDADRRVLRLAAEVAAREVRTLDAIHIATALRARAAELVAYDRRTLHAAQAQGLSVASPGVR